jgi:hypothetical protein
MDYVKGFIGFIVAAIILFYLSAYADDLQFMIGEAHESLYNTPMAIRAYENVIYEYGNKIHDAKVRLAALGVVKYKRELEAEKKFKKFLKHYPKY